MKFNYNIQMFSVKNKIKETIIPFALNGYEMVIAIHWPERVLLLVLVFFDKLKNLIHGFILSCMWY